MAKVTDDGKEFGNDVDRLIVGAHLKPGGTHEEDYDKAVKFARRMLESRADPSPAFAENLRKRLLQKMANAEIEEERENASHRGVWDTFRSLVPGSPVWRTVTVTVAVLVVALVVVWRIGGFSGSTSPPMLGSTLPPGGISKSPVEVTVVTSGNSFSIGEEISVTLTFKSTGSEALTLTPFPPQMIIAAASLMPYRSIPGGESRVLSPGELVECTVTWDQLDNQGQQVPPGDYIFEMLDIELAGGRGTVTLQEPPHILIVSR